MKILIIIIGITIMGQLFGNKPKPKPKPQQYGKYGNPFEMSPEQKKHAYRQMLEGRAVLIKKMTKSSSSVEDIAAELSLAEMRRKK